MNTTFQVRATSHSGKLEGGRISPVESRSGERRWRKTRRLWFTTYSVDWQSKYEFVRVHRVSTYTNFESDGFYSKTSWFLINLGVIAFSSAFMISLMMFSLATGNSKGFLLAFPFLCMLVFFLAFFVWLTYIPPGHGEMMDSEPEEDEVKFPPLPKFE